MIGDSVSHYTILEKLGEGGMGVVYKARDGNLDRLVAIKFLPFSLTADEQILQQFIHEAKTVSTLDHPNICPIHEFDNDGNGRMFMVMPYYNGDTLHDRIVRAHGNLPMPINEIISIAMQIAGGLKKAHEQGIVHRDIKPSNIIITRENGVKILDFGLAKLKGELHKGEKQSISGTTHYMSPEQHFSDRLDHRTDIWSLGVLMYEMCSGGLPFQAEYDQSVAYATLKKEHKPLSTICQDVPNTLELIVDTCLQKDPDNRYPNIGELLEDLRSLENKADQEKKSEKQKSIKRSYLYTLAAFILILIIISGYVFYPGPSDFDTKTTIAVLPFENLSGDPEDEYFSEGITEDIRAQLSKISNLKVLSTISVVKYKQQQYNLSEIAERLHATVVLEGSVRRAEKRVRLVCHLFDAETEDRLWTETYDRQMRDIFVLQSDIAKDIAAKLKSVFTIEEKKRIETIPTRDLTAYDYYLKGRNYFNRNTRAGDENAIKLFKKAIELDPHFALAYTGLADAYAWRGEQERLFPRTWIDSAITICQKAINLDSNTSETYKVMGRAYLQKGMYQKSLNAFYEAINLNSSNWKALEYIGRIYNIIGRYEESLIWLNKALQIAPTEIMIYRSIAMSYLHLKEYDKSIYWYEKAIELKPDLNPLHLAIVYMEQGKNEKAIEIFEGTIQSDSTNDNPYHDLAIVYQNQGMPSKAIPLLKKAIKLNPNICWHYMALAGIYVEQDNLEKALAIYQQGMKRVAPYLYMSLNYSFLLSRANKRREAREVLAEVTIPSGDWNESMIKFYLGEITESEMEEKLKYTFFDVAGKRVLSPEQSYFLGMAYLHNLDTHLQDNPSYISKAIEYLQKYHQEGNLDGLEHAYVRAELKRLGAFKIKD